MGGDAGAAPGQSPERLDVGAVARWLREHHPALLAHDIALKATRFPGGYSNLTYRLDTVGAPSSTTWVLRRPPYGAASGNAHDMAREFGVLSALHPQGIPVPQPLACCTDPAVIGAPFYLMEHVDGVIVRGAMPAFSSSPGDGEQRVRKLSQLLVETLAQLHAVDVRTGPLASLGRPDGYVARQVAGWTRRWEASRTSAVPAMDRLAEWLASHVAAPSGVALLHNDFKLDNLVLAPTLDAVRAILDWEMATVGDPLMDLGTTLAYWVEPTDAPVFRALGLGATAQPGAYRRAEVVAVYEEATGKAVPDAAFYEAFGVFKVAVIAQQIFARFEAGMASDARFAGLGEVVRALGERGRERVG